MKLHSNTHWTPQAQTAGNSFNTTLHQTLSFPFRKLMLALGAALPAFVIVILTAWAIGNGSTDILAASQWATAFIFLALSVESYGKQAAALAVSGITLGWLAWMGSRVSPEFAILAAFLIAAWASFSVLQYLRRN
jgi:hypothetical protein